MSIWAKHSKQAHIGIPTNPGEIPGAGVVNSHLGVKLKE